MDPATNGAHGDVKGIADLLIGQADDIAEHHRGAVLGRQAAQGLLHIVGEGLGGHGHVSTRAGRHDAIGIVGEKVERAALPSPGLVEECIGGDTAQPPFQRTRLVGLEAPTDPEKHFLHQILRVVVIAGQAIGHRVQEAPVVSSNLFPCGYPTACHENDGRSRPVPLS